jgi:hypothetical protein
MVSRTIGENASLARPQRTATHENSRNDAPARPVLESTEERLASETEMR